ncbi:MULTISPECIES: hypothetical protein [Paraburkholderia]|uniref:hypothetical protein n=1 Tax=Paraburkholderia TaxID=1822464 RepID=UPI003B796A28
MEKDNKVPFPFAREEAAFMTAFAADVATQVGVRRSAYLPTDNVYRFMHGLQMSSQNETSPSDVTVLQRTSHEVCIARADLLQGDCSLVFRQMGKLVDGFETSMREKLYQTVAEAAVSVGNVISAHKRPIAETILELLEKLEFGVDRQGRPTMPQLHAAPDVLAALRSDPQFNDPQFKQKIEEVVERKKSNAQAREAERVARFK